MTPYLSNAATSPGNTLSNQSAAAVLSSGLGSVDPGRIGHTSASLRCTLIRAVSRVRNRSRCFRGIVSTNACKLSPNRTSAGPDTSAGIASPFYGEHATHGQARVSSDRPTDAEINFRNHNSLRDVYELPARPLVSPYCTLARQRALAFSLSARPTVYVESRRAVTLQNHAFVQGGAR